MGYSLSCSTVDLLSLLEIRQKFLTIAMLKAFTFSPICKKNLLCYNISTGICKIMLIPLTY